MRVAIVNKFAYVTGGADRHCLDLAEVLRAHGHTVAFLSTASDRNLATEGVFIRCAVTNASRDELTWPERGGVALRSIWNREAAIGMSRLIDRFRPDVVHTHKLYPQLSVAPVVAAARRVPIVQTLHDYELMSASALDADGGRLDHDEQLFAYRLLNTGTFPIRRCLHTRRVRAFVAVSRAIARSYEARGITAHAVPNFVPLAAVARELPLGYEGRSGILFVGRLVEQKGITDVIDVARDLPAVPVSVAGSGPLAATVEAAAGVLPNLRYLGRLPSKPLQEHLRRARILLVPSRWEEPGPLAVVEAMAAGTPVVASARGGLAEYVRDAGAGVIVADFQYSHACRSLLENERLWLAASASGLAAAHGVHSVERYVEQIVATYEEARAA